jgi:4-hydroxythreonine-4-phosphate dehydrogenase
MPAWPVIGLGDPPPGGRGVAFLDCRQPGDFVPGRPTAGAGRAALKYLDVALVRWSRGEVHALVTAPVTKWAVAKVHPGFVGHTEYLADAVHARRVAMLFISDRLKIALVTRHIALRDVPAALTRAALTGTAALTAEALSRWFGIPRPHLAFCGLNPHAGEGSGAREERRVIVPVMRALRSRGITCSGPFAADGFFAGDPGRYDAAVCAYHDQGLIAFKMAARDRGCQLTAGLPFVRTSPDHGSALDIAGGGIAKAGSMAYALSLAARLAKGEDRKYHGRQWRRAKGEGRRGRINFEPLRRTPHPLRQNSHAHVR